MENDFTIRLEGTTLYIYLGYELTSQNAPELQEALQQYRSQNITKMVFDATDLVYISSLGEVARAELVEAITERTGRKTVGPAGAPAGDRRKRRTAKRRLKS